MSIANDDKEPLDNNIDILNPETTCTRNIRSYLTNSTMLHKKEIIFEGKTNEELISDDISLRDNNLLRVSLDKIAERDCDDSISTQSTNNTSRIMEKDEEEELERMRLERMSNGRRRGAFYAANTSNNSPKVFDYNPEEIIPESPSPHSGYITLRRRTSQGMCNHIRNLTGSNRVHCGYAETIGRRSTMEDNLMFTGNIKQGYDIFGVFDGHRGDHSSSFAAEKFGGSILSRLDEEKPISEVLIDSFIEINETMKEEGIVGGTTAVVGILTQTHCTIAHVGDTRAVLCLNDKAIRLTQDHKPDRIDEVERITKLGGEITNIVMKNGKINSRVLGLLSVSRSLGDHDLEPFVAATPEIYEIDLTSQIPDFLIIGCDGLWDTMTDEEAVITAKAVLKNSNAEIVSCTLRDIAYARGSTDNITVMCIKFLVADEILSEVDEYSKCICNVL